MAKQYERVSLTAGRDYRFSFGYEYVVMAEIGDDAWTILARQGGFRNKAAAVRAGRVVAEPFCAPALL